MKVRQTQIVTSRRQYPLYITLKQKIGKLMRFGFNLLNQVNVSTIINIRLLMRTFKQLLKNQQNIYKTKKKEESNKWRDQTTKRHYDLKQRKEKE